MKTSFEKFMASSAVNKVELSIGDDIDNYAKKAVQLRKELQDIENAIDQAKKLIDNAKAKSKEGETWHTQAVKIGTQFASQMEDLGIEPRSNQKYNSFFEAINAVQEKASRIATKIKSL